MSDPRESAGISIAHQLIHVLDEYAHDVDRLAGTWLGMDLYLQVSKQVDDIKSLSGAVPTLTSAWTRLLIAHTDLIHSLYRPDAARAGLPKVPNDLGSVLCH